MGVFDSMKEKLGKGIDWGKAVVSDTVSVISDGVEQFKDYAVEKVDQIGEIGRDKVHSVAREQSKKIALDRDLLNSIDRRKDFTSRTTQPCILSSGPPVKYDGYFLGKDCMKPTNVKPEKGEGRKPKGCENCSKEFPQVTYTNGIDNTLGDACDTIQQLADELCMEVVGIFNASYKDAVPPPRSAEENMALLKAGGKGAVDGAVDGVRDGIPSALVAGVTTGGGAVVSLGKDALKGAAKGAVVGVGKEGLKQQASRWVPQSQDALDVIDTLVGRSQQPATVRMADDIANQLRDGKQVNLIGHSEGGVNTVAAIAQAKRQLADGRKDALRSANPGMSPETARLRANAEVESVMAKNMNVTLLGTQQTGLPDGPNYTRVAHKNDLVPDGISGTQDAIGFPGHDKEPSSSGKPSPPVERFTGHEEEDSDGILTNDLNPATAHAMKNSYIPYMRKKTGKAKGASCC